MLDPRELRERLPRELFALPLLRTFGKALFLLAVVAALLVAGTTAESLVLKAALAPVMGVALFALAAVGHESGHRTASRSRFLNDLTGLVTMSISGIPARGWKAHHDLHHKHTGVPAGDSDAQVTVSKYVMLGRRQRSLVRFVNEHEFLFWPLSPMVLAVLCWSQALAILAKGGRASRRTRAWTIADLSLALAVYAALVLYGFLFGWLEFLLCLALPYAAGGVVAEMTFATNHHNMPPLDAEQRARVSKYYHVNTRTLLFPRWVPGNFFVSHIPWQLEHHMFPNIPGFRLRRVHAYVRGFAAEKGATLHCSGFFEAVAEVACTRYAWGSDGRLHAFADLDRLIESGVDPASIPGYAEAAAPAAGRRPDLRDLLHLR